MWIVRWFFTLLLLIYAVLFAAMNLEPISLTLPWIPPLRFAVAQKAVVVLLAVAVGVVIWAVVAFLGSLELRSKIRGLERRNRELKEELSRLRNLSVLDDHELEGASTAAGTPQTGVDKALLGDSMDEVTAARNSGL